MARAELRKAEGHSQGSISSIFPVKGRRGAGGLKSSPMGKAIRATTSTKEPESAQEEPGGQGGGAKLGCGQNVNYTHTRHKTEALKTIPLKNELEQE